MHVLPLTAKEVEERLLKLDTLSADAALHEAAVDSAQRLIRVDVDYTIKDGTEVKFRSPVDCSEITGLVVYYPNEENEVVSQEFAFADAKGNNVGDIENLFAENVVVKVILDTDTSMAFVQNASTNAYLEARFDALTSDWNAVEGEAGHIKNKPFGEIASNQYFDGDLTGREYINLTGLVNTSGEMYLVKMSNYTPTEAECWASTMGIVALGKRDPAPVTDVRSISETMGVQVPGFAVGTDVTNPLVIITESVSIEGISITPGTYTIYGNDDGEIYTWYFSALEGKVDKIKTIDPKFLPDGIGYTLDANPYFDGNLTGYDAINVTPYLSLVRVADAVLTEQECIGALIRAASDDGSYDDEEMYVVEDWLYDASTEFGVNGFYIMPDFGLQTPFIFVCTKDTNIDGIDVKAGTYYIYININDSDMNMLVYTTYFSALEGKKGSIHKIDPKYLPEGIGYGAEINPYFDGNIAGREHLEITDLVSSTVPFHIVKISDYALTEEECIGETVTINVSGELESFNVTEVQDLSSDSSNIRVSGFVIAQDEFFPFVFVIKENIELDGIAVSAGTYYVYAETDNGGTYVRHFSALENKGIHKIDPKYLPEGIGYTTKRALLANEILTTVDADGFVYLEYTNCPITYEEIKNYEQVEVVFNGISYTCPVLIYHELADDDSFIFGEQDFEAEVVKYPFTFVGDIYSKTVYFITKNPGSYQVSVYAGTEVHKIDPKYLPEGIGYEERSIISPVSTLAYDDYTSSYVVPNFVPEAGKTYEITYNGAIYTCTAFAFTHPQYGEAIGVGNKAAIGGEDSGEPFAIGYIVAFNASGCTPLDGNTDINVGVVEKELHKIDEKYLPESVALKSDIQSVDPEQITTIINNAELITVNDIDIICGASIQYVDMNSGVTF